MPVGDGSAQPLAAWGAAMRASHIGGGPGLVDEDQPVGVEIRLTIEPLPTPRQNVWTILLRSMGGLFLRVIRCRRKNRCSVP